MKVIITGVKNIAELNTSNLNESNCFCSAFVPQLKILSLVDIFVSHCGMNSLNGILYTNFSIIGF